MLLRGEVRAYVPGKTARAHDSFYTVDVGSRITPMQVKEAVETASKYLPEIFESAKGKELRLEGVEKSEDGRFWKVTFSYDTTNPTSLLRMLRDYKTVKLRDANGEFMGAQDGNLLAAL